jgi:hypothetical protein
MATTGRSLASSLPPHNLPRSPWLPQPPALSLQLSLNPSPTTAAITTRRPLFPSLPPSPLSYHPLSRSHLPPSPRWIRAPPADHCRHRQPRRLGVSPNLHAVSEVNPLLYLVDELNFG